MGSSPEDFAGSITYCFDPQKHIQRIVLHGYLVDPTPLIQLVTTRYSMQRVPSPIDDFYVANIDGKMIGAMRLRYASVVRSEVPGHREVLLELNRTGTPYGISREFQRGLQAGK